MANTTISITGMTCGGCAASVAQALKRQAGVRGVEVFLAAGRATVEFDEQRTTPAVLAAAVGKAGFAAAVA
jgi:copper chaperone CopZ